MKLARLRILAQPRGWLCAFAVLFALNQVHSLEFSLNGQVLSVPAPAALRTLTYPLAPSVSARQPARGIALSELLPPLVEAWRLQVQGSAGSRTWAQDELAEMLGSFFIVEGPGGSWDLTGPESLTSASAPVLRVPNVGTIALQGESAREGELEVWLSWEGVPELKAEIERWSRLTGVRVKTVEVPDTRSKLLAVMRGGGRVPDLLMIQSDNVADLVQAKALQPLDRLAPTRLDEKGRSAFRSGGKLWALPFYFDTQILYYNRALLSPEAASRLAGSWTTADLESISRGILAAGRTPVSWNVYSAYWLLSFALGFGRPSVEDADGGVRPDDPGTRKAVDWMLSLIDRGILVPLERDAMIARFAAGDIAMILSGSYSIPEFERIGIDFGIAAYPLAVSTGAGTAPGTVKGARQIPPLLDYKGFAMTRSTRSPVSARRLLDHLTSIGVQQRFTSALSKLPAMGAARQVMPQSPWQTVLAKSADAGEVIPPGPGYGIYKNIMWKILRFILSGSMKPDAALAEARRLIDANLREISR
jgi:arabinogalactan oligomer/maltooligosaccharide transport system substrate-binding protein